MLARRAVARSFLHLRHNAIKPTRDRAFSYLPPHAQFQARPPTWSAKLWYRRDGTPRSRLKGLIIGTIASATLYTMYTMLALVDEFDTANYLLSGLIHIQRIDTEYSSVDPSEFKSIHSYFQEMCSALFGDIPQQMIDDFFGDVDALVGSSKDEAHRVLRETCEEVHMILVDSKWRDPIETAGKAVARLDEGLLQLVEMVQDTYGDEFGKMLKAQKIGSQTLKDSAAKGGEYEVVG
ncbi:hypothetical protein D9615_000934 [Tricholomella constricta]|uniref:Uncharacterized protein n=1 Tax=Tricholomella constricta TaxID=117010 RepID=A0A8H5HLC5_9AGAR|nr:hypothetical protein D9615_000934 [Tricholomella constricta]